MLEVSKTSGQCQLPTELLILIAFFVSDRKYIARLCLVSKDFRTIYTPELYRAISVDACSAKAIIALQFSLYQVLRTLQFSHFVTDLRLCIRRAMVCSRWTPHRSKAHPSKPCTCANYEEALGCAILTLHNLHTLAIKCTLCEESHSHGYLFDMKIPSLRLFAFRCFRSPKGLKASILQIPFMNEITMLNLECYENHKAPDDTLLTQDSAFAPQLRTICLDRTEFTHKLLSTRRIERLCADSFTRRLPSYRLPLLLDSISKSPGKLSHILLIDLLQWLPTAIERNLEPYRHLRFIGTITVADLEDIGAFEEMECLSSLSNLKTIEINRYRRSTYPGSFKVDTSSDFRPGIQFFLFLERKHPSLRRVLLMFRNPDSDSMIRVGEGRLWERSEGWSQRRVPYLEYWDLLCNKLGSVYLPNDEPAKAR